MYPRHRIQRFAVDLTKCFQAIANRFLHHIVGFDATIQFAVEKSGSWKSTILGGEGLVCRLTGPGRVLMQSRSEQAFLGWLLPKIPSRSN